jgi:uncharacterized membrane protein YoaK (UPF0700 family)
VLRPRDSLLILLALATGATDAAAFEHLGHVFASVITGNLVLLGVGVVSGDHHLTLFTGCALAGYIVGVLIGAPRRKRSPPTTGWPRGATIALVKELLLLVAFGVGWEIAGSHPTEAWHASLVTVAAAAMGIQSTAVRRFGQISTTYLTSTLTALFEDLRARRRSPEQVRSVGILATALVGAAAATALVLHARPVLPVLQLVPVAAVILGSRRLPLPEPPDSSAPVAASSASAVQP